MATSSSVTKLVDDINKRLERPMLHVASDTPDVFRIKSHNPAIDYITCGGYPVNRIIEHYGDPQRGFSCLKSFTGYCLIREFQHTDWANREQNAFANLEFAKRKKDSSFEIPALIGSTLRRGYKPKKTPRFKYAVLVDLEGTYTRDWGEHIGLNNDGLIYCNPDTVEDAINITEAFLSSEDISFVMLDSMSVVGAAVETNNEMEKEQMAANARMWNKAIRKFQSAINRNNDNDVTLLLINSGYMAVGTVFGNPERIKNGGQLQLSKSMSIRFSGHKEIKGKVEDVEITTGRMIGLKNSKNKVGVPYREADFFYSYVSDGVCDVNEPDVVGSLIEFGIRYGLIDRRGSNYSYGDIKANGMEKFRTTLVEKGDIKSLKKDVYAKFIPETKTKSHED